MQMLKMNNPHGNPITTPMPRVLFLENKSQ